MPKTFLRYIVWIQYTVVTIYSLVMVEYGKHEIYVHVMLKISYYLLTKSEVFLGKSQTKTLLY